MSVQVISKSKNIKNSNDKSSPQIYTLDFVFKYSSSDSSVAKVRETIEYLCWVNSVAKKQVDNIGWVEDESKLPKYDNNEIYLPHHMYYSNFISRDFLSKHCPHIKALAREEHDYHSANRKVGGGRYAAA